MTRTVLLDNIAHKDLWVRTGYSAEFGDSINHVPVFPTEFAHVQREYPILFRRDAGGGPQAGGGFRLRPRQKLFPDGPSRGGRRYVPAVLQKGPFLIGFRKQEADGDIVNEPVIHVDLDHPRISTSEGEPVFLRHGGNSPYLEHANRMLQIIYRGTLMARAMFAAFEEAGLIEPPDIGIQLEERVE